MVNPRLLRVFLRAREPKAGEKSSVLFTLMYLTTLFMVLVEDIPRESEHPRSILGRESPVEFRNRVHFASDVVVGP